MFEIIGWVGGILLALCAAPEAYRTFRDKHCYVGWGMLSMWGLGEICLFVFEFAHEPTFQRSFNYLLNLLFIGYMLYYKIKDNNEKTRV